MSDTFAPLQRQRAAEQIAEQLRDAILQGRFGPGDRLPSERDLADQFEVNRSTVREALHRLEANGIVEMRHGGGTRVRDFLVSAGLQLLPHLVAPGGTLNTRLLADVLEMRVALLEWTARTAADRATPPGVDALAADLAALEAATTPQARQEADFAYFEQLVAITDNRVLALLAHAMREVYLENRALFSALYVNFDPAHHKATLAAVRAADGDAAAAAMGAWARVFLLPRSAR